MCLHVLLISIKHSTALTIGSYWQLFSKLLDQGISKHIVGLLAFWYQNQKMCVKWQMVFSEAFGIGNGVRQGGILSPFLFRFYIRKLIAKG